MTETPAESTESELYRDGLRGRAWRFARRWSSNAAGRSSFPLLVVVSLFLSLSWLGVFRVLPDMARLAHDGALGRGGACRALSAALLPPAVGRRDRPPHRARQRARPYAGAGADRPAERQGRAPSPRRLWREHQRRMARKPRRRRRRPAAHRAFPSATPGACAPPQRCCWSTAFAFSFGPLGGRVADGFQAHGRLGDHPAAHRRLGDAARLYRQGAGVPHRATANAGRRTARSPCPRAATCRCASPAGRARRRWSSPTQPGRCATIEAARRRPADPAKPAPTGAAGEQRPAVRRQAHRRRHAVAEIRRPGASAWAFAVTPDKPPVIRFSGEPKRAANGALRTRLRDRGRLRRGVRRGRFRSLTKSRRRTRTRSTRRPEMKLTLPRRGAKGPAAKTSRDLTEHVWAGSAHQADAEGDRRSRPGSGERDQDLHPAGAHLHQSARQGGRRAPQDLLARRQPQAGCARPDRRDHAAARGHDREPVALSRHHDRPHQA